MKKLLLCVFFLAAMSAGCEKTDYNKLEGTVWEAETDDAAFSLHFVDGSTCTLTTVRNNVSYSANRTDYSWRYRSPEESMWGHFFIWSAENGDGFKCGGTVENKTLYLSCYDMQGETLAFRRK